MEEKVWFKAIITIELTFLLTFLRCVLSGESYSNWHHYQGINAVIRINQLSCVIVEIDKGWLYAICKRIPDGRRISFCFGIKRRVGVTLLSRKSEIISRRKWKVEYTIVLCIIEIGIERAWVFQLMAIIAILISYIVYHLVCKAIHIWPETMKELR